ncbi:MAG: phospho-sugar mutase, partial [Clostridia bacterium]|nr:phospho-sugar mutase [Clostridia bacterium]
VVIACDTRNNSTLFAKCAADVFTAEGIPARLFDAPVPTPVLSFAVRHFGACAGVVVTASHNPSAYNGYKAYDETGCQLGPDAADAVYAIMQSVTDWSRIPTEGNDSLLTMIGAETLEAFEEAVLKQATFRDADAKKDLKIVYTPIHGTGLLPITSVLKKDGFTDVNIVEEQTSPDGNFPTVKSPNPEEKWALQMGIDLAERIGADLVIGSDPDADRVGTAVRHEGKISLLSGNQIGALLVDFLLKNRTVPGSNPTVITSIVTGEMGPKIARAHGCCTQNVLTGFRFIGNAITAFDREIAEKRADAHHFLIGYEESYGYLVGNHARDKDAVVAAMLVAEMAAWHKSNGRTLIDALNLLYEEYGYYLDTVKAFSLQGKEGVERIAAMMATLRAEPDFLPDAEVLDYSKGIDGFPPSNALKFCFKDSSWIAARPSGTEPKIKFYYCIRGKDRAEAQAKFDAFHNAILAKTGL